MQEPVDISNPFLSSNTLKGGRMVGRDVFTKAFYRAKQRNVNKSILLALVALVRF